MKPPTVRCVLCALVLLVAASGCGGGEPAPATGGSAASAAQSAGAAATNPNAPVAFTDADLDAYERGMRKEIELVRAAKEQGANAKTPEERGAAAQAEWEATTAPAAAQAIGAPVDHYRATRRTVNRVFETFDFQGKIPGPMELDIVRASPEMKARLASDPLAELTPESAAALKARLNRLAAVWIEYITLVAVAG